MEHYFGNISASELKKGVSIEEVIALAKQCQDSPSLELAKAHMGNPMASMRLEETLALINESFGKDNPTFAKSFTQSLTATSGITAYSLEAPAKMIYPVLTPHRNETPRVSALGGIQAAWRAVTGVNVNNKAWGISEGNRSQVTTNATADYTAAYKGGGSDSFTTWEAEYAGEGFQDVYALDALTLLHSTMIEEERIILGGNNSIALTQIGTVTKTLQDAGGSLPDSTTYYIQVVGLTAEGLAASSVAGGLPISGNITLADGTVEARKMGTSQPSAEVSQATGTGGAGNAHQITLSWPVKNGAVAYAIYWGTVSGQGILGAIVSNNSYIIKAAATGTQTANLIPNSDNSRNSLVYDGYLYQIFNSAVTNAYVVAQATGTPGTGTPLTGDGYGQIVEFENVLQYMWDNYRLSPTEIWWNSREARNATPKILAGQANTTQRFNFIVEQDKLTGGVIVKNYWNRYGLTDELQSIPLRIDPNLPPGTVFFNTKWVPYKMSNVTNVSQMRMRREYHQVDWVPTARKKPIGVYWDGVLQCYVPFAQSIITNIANG